MLSVSLMGGLCNMMFQIATIEDMGRRTELNVCYPNVNSIIDKLSQASTWTANAREYLNVFKNLDWRKNLNGFYKPDRIVRIPFRYTTIYPEDNTHYVGYFQSESYFQDREFILNLFEPSNHIKEKLEKYKDVLGENKASIHVRRGNYLDLRHIYEVLPIDYYKDAMEYLKTYGVEEYLVFGNDMKWCRDNFIGDQFTFIEDVNYVELFLMSQTAHQIIANSSFSWWAGYLNTDIHKRVIAPAKWFSNDNEQARDIVPWHWIKI